jgi:hypothetical protein
MGTANGIVCRGCGATFRSFAEIHPEPEKPAEPPQEAAEKPKRGRKKKEDA